MSDLTLSPALSPGRDADAPMPLALQYGVTLAMVAGVVVLAEVFEALVSSANVTLFFVLPVVVSATSFGWGPALTASLTGALAFDFFFTEPKFSFAIASPGDISDAVLLLAIAAIVSTVAADSRRKALEARRAAERANALRSLAHAVTKLRSEAEIARAAAVALNQIFRAPAAIFGVDGGRLELIASTGPSQPSEADENAARVAVASHVPTRATAYPTDDASFDFWPISAGTGCSFVLGIDFIHSREARPVAPDPFVEMVGGYLAAAGAARV